MPNETTPPHKAIATLSSILLLVALIGLTALTQLLLIWAACIFFGIAGLARALLEWRRERPRQ